jgi:hypothetical protein
MRVDRLSDDALGVVLSIAQAKGWRWLVDELEAEDRRRRCDAEPVPFLPPLAEWTLEERQALTWELYRLHQGGRLLGERDEDGAGELYEEIAAAWLELALALAPPDQRRRLEAAEAMVEAALEEAEEAGRRARQARLN